MIQSDSETSLTIILNDNPCVIKGCILDASMSMSIEDMPMITTTLAFDIPSHKMPIEEKVSAKDCNCIFRLEDWEVEFTAKSIVGVVYAIKTFMENKQGSMLHLSTEKFAETIGGEYITRLVIEASLNADLLGEYPDDDVRSYIKVCKKKVKPEISREEIVLQDLDRTLDEDSSFDFLEI